MTPRDLASTYKPEMDRLYKKFTRLKLRSAKFYKAENMLRLLGEANLFLLAQAAAPIVDQQRVNVAFTLSEFCAAYARQIVIKSFPAREPSGIFLRG